MAQVVNQNHISDIVRQNVALTHEIISIITDTTLMASNIISLVERFKATNDSIYGNDGSGGVMGQIVEINNNMVEHNRLKIMPGRDKLLKFHFEEILKIMKYMKKLGRNTLFMKDERIQRATTVINYLKDINDTLNSIKFNPMLSINLEFLNQSIDKLNADTIPYIRNMSIKTLLISQKGLNKITEIVFPFINNVFDILKQYKFTQLFFLKKKLNMVTDIILSLEDVINELLKFSIKNFWKGIIGNSQFKLIRNIFDNLKSIIEFVDDMNMIDTTSRKLRLLSKYVTYIFRIAHKVISRMQGKMYGIFNLIATVVKMRLFAVIFAELMMIIDYVQNSRTFLLKGKLKTLRSNLFRLFNIVFDLIIYTSLFKPIALIKCIIKLFLIKKIFQLLAGTIAFATLAALVSVPFLILAIPFIAAIIAMCYVIEILILYASTISVKDLLKLMLIISIILLISLIGLALVTLALVAETVMRSYGWILLFILGLIPIVLLMLLLGYVTISLAFIAVPAVIGMFAMAVMITAVMLMALQLKLLEKIHLDRRAIMDTVDTIMDVANEIIYSLFASDDAQKDIDKAGKSKSWFGAFMGIFVSNKVMLQAILSAGIMALTFVSVTMILLIALELKLLQQEAMKLDRDRVLSSVDKVLGTAKFIGDCIFKGKYYDDGTGEIRTDYDHDQKTWLGKMFTGIGTILNTICSSAIMMMSFISISMIWLMAKELTSLQNIELNKDAIAANIEKIITTAKQVIDVVNAPSDTKEKNKDDGIIGKLLNFVLPSNMKYMIDAISTMGFTAITMIAIGIICKIGKQLTKIQELPKLDKVQSNTRVLMETCKAVIGIVEDQNFNVKELAKHIKAVRRIKNLVKNIADLINIEVKEDKLSSNIGTLVTSANNIITSIDDINAKNINLDRIDKIAEMFRGIKKLVNVANGATVLTIDELGYTSFIRSVNNIMKELHPKRVGAIKRNRFEHHINIFRDLNESIKHTNETVSPTDISNIVDNESSYIKLVNLINKVAKELHPKRVGVLKRNKFNKQLMVFGALTSYVNKNYEDIASVSSKTFVAYNESGYGQFIGLLGDSCKDIIKLVENKTPDTAIKYASKLNNLLEEFSQNNNKVDLNKLKETTNNYIKFLDKIGSIKIDNLTKAASVFKQMARFSESINGNFEGLAETINEKLMPVLEELKQIMGDNTDKLEKGFNSTTETLVATSPVPVSQRGMTNIEKARNPQMSDSQASAAASKKMEAQMRAQNQTLAAKLDEVIELLSGRGKINAMVTY
jgi:hypothetical protein